MRYVLRWSSFTSLVSQKGVPSICIWATSLQTQTGFFRGNFNKRMG